MQIHKTSAHALCARLTRQELSAYRLTFDELCAHDARTEALIRAVLTRAEQRLGWALPPRGKLLVDALPSPNGGTTLLLTASTKPTRYRVKKQPFSLICRVSTADTLLSLLRRIKLAPFAGASFMLYRYKDEYFLLVAFRTPNDLPSGRNALLEFGDVFDGSDRAQAYLQEYAVKLRGCEPDMAK